MTIDESVLDQIVEIAYDESDKECFDVELIKEKIRNIKGITIEIKGNEN